MCESTFKVEAEQVAEMLTRKFSTEYIQPLLDRYKANLFMILIEEESLDSLVNIKEVLLNIDSIKSQVIH